MDVLTLLGTAAARLGIPVPTTYSSDPNLLNLLYEVSEECRNTRAFPQQKRSHSFGALVDVTDYLLPADYHSPLLKTHFDRGNTEELEGPVLDSDWNELLYGVESNTYPYKYRIFGPNAQQISNSSMFKVYPAPGEGSDNSIDNPSDFDNAAWTKTRSNVTANAVANPVDGTVDADLLYDDSTASNTHFAKGTAIDVVAGTIYEFSVYAKRVARNISLSFEDIGGVTTAFGGAIAHFNLATGVITSVTGSIQAGIKDVGNGWYRCVIGAKAAAHGTSRPSISLANVAGTTSYSGDSASGAYIYKAFFREPEVFSFDYITKSTFFTSGSTLSTTAKETVAADTDIPMFDDDILIAGLKAAYKESKGIDSASDRMKFEKMLEAAVTRYVGPFVGNFNRRSLDRGAYSKGGVLSWRF